MLVWGSKISPRYIHITRSASCSMLPESRKSDRTGTGGLRCSISRLSWESAITGIFKSLARILSSRLISDTSCCRFSLRRPVLVNSCK
jgi:hypothetical protein